MSLLPHIPILVSVVTTTLPYNSFFTLRLTLKTSRIFWQHNRLSVLRPLPILLLLWTSILSGTTTQRLQWPHNLHDLSLYLNFLLLYQPSSSHHHSQVFFSHSFSTFFFFFSHTLPNYLMNHWTCLVEWAEIFSEDL